ncbi:MAG: hydrogenase accessory protein HypB, partial [Prochlorotrichaceae cyanobacterium]
MCQDCGCSVGGEVRIQAEHQEHSHAVNGSHSHEHPDPSHHHHDATDQTHSHHSDHPHIHPKRQTISLETNILAKNDR